MLVDLHMFFTDMLLVDKELVVVADWGIETSDSPISNTLRRRTICKQISHTSGLFKETSAKASACVSRGEGTTEIRVLVWRSGFARGSRHINIAWLDYEPPNTVGSLDDF